MTDWLEVAKVRRSYSKARILKFLAKGPSNTGEVAREMKINWRTAYGHVRGLRKKGLIVYLSDQLSNYHIIDLSEKGREIVRYL